jgi:hypothetical protein
VPTRPTKSTVENPAHSLQARSLSTASSSAFEHSLQTDSEPDTPSWLVRKSFDAVFSGMMTSSFVCCFDALLCCGIAACSSGIVSHGSFCWEESARASKNVLHFSLLRVFCCQSRLMGVVCHQTLLSQQGEHRHQNGLSNAMSSLSGS